MTVKPLKIRKRGECDMASLAKQRRDFIFSAVSAFAPVKREEIRGAGALLTIFDEVIERIKNFQFLTSIGLHPGGTLLLYGPKRTGKTYFSRYLATVSGARFVNIRNFPKPNTDEDGRETALCAEDVRELYKLAREFVKKHDKPIILFYDEFDGVEGGALEELRIQIDGVAGRTDGVFLVATAAVETVEEIDSGLFGFGRALTEPILFGYQTPQGKLDTLRYYVSLVDHDPGVDLESIASLFQEETSPAAIQQFVSDAYTRANLDNKNGAAKLTERLLAERCVRNLIGFEMDNERSHENDRTVANHEACHAASGRYLGLPIPLVTILPMRNAEIETRGATMVGIPENRVVPLKVREDLMVFYLCGIIGQRRLGFPDDDGIGFDLINANMVAQKLVGDNAHGKLTLERYGCIVLNRPRSEYSERLRTTEELDITSFVKTAEKRAVALMRKIGKRRLRRVAMALLEKKTILQNELRALLK